MRGLERSPQAVPRDSAGPAALAQRRVQREHLQVPAEVVRRDARGGDVGDVRRRAAAVRRAVPRGAVPRPPSPTPQALAHASQREDQNAFRPNVPPFSFAPSKPRRAK